MATDRTGAYLRGISVPLAHREIWHDQSGEYDAAGARLSVLISGEPIVGEVTLLSDRSDLLPIITGTPEAGPIYLRILQPGFPGQDQLGSLWSDVSSTASLRGCDLPSVSHGYDPYDTGGTYRRPHVCEISGGTLTAYYESSAVAGLYVRQWLRSGGYQAPVMLGPDPGYVMSPCLLRIPQPDGTDRIHCYYALQISSGDWQVRYQYSDDDGATWAGGGEVLEDPISGTTYADVTRARVAYHSGQTILVLHLVPTAGEDVIGQWAASDGGQRFQEIEIWDPAVRIGACPEVAVLDGVFYAAYLALDTGPAPAIHVCKLEGAFAKISQALAVSPNMGTLIPYTPAAAPASITDGELALWSDDDGALYLTARSTDDGHWAVWSSRDAGDTIVRTGLSAVGTVNYSTWHRTDALAAGLLHTPAELSACSSRGQTHLHHGALEAVGGGSALTGHLYRTLLGGHSTVTLPTYGGVTGPSHRVAYSYTWSGWSDPTVSAAWTVVGAGGAVVGDVYTVPAGDVYTVPLLGGTLATGAIWESEGELIGVAGGIHVQYEMTLRSGAAGYAARLEVTTVACTLRDAVSGAQIGIASPLVGGTYPHRIRIAMAGSSVQAWVLASSDVTPEDQVWTLIGQTDALTDGGGGAALTTVTITAIRDTDLRWSGYVTGVYVGDHLTSAHVWTDLYPRPIRGVPVYLGDGLSIEAKTGPGVRGDAWSVAVDYEYPPEALDPVAALSGWYASPAWPWRSRPIASMAVGTATLRVSWQVSEAAADEYQDGDLLCLYVDRSTLPPGTEVHLLYGGVWVSAALLGSDGWTATGSGRTLTVAAVGVSGDGVYHLDDLAGCIVTHGAGRSTITASSPGSTRVGHPVPVSLRLASAPPAGPQAITVWPRRWVSLIRLSAHARAIRGVQLRIPISAALTPPDGWHEVGIAHLGSVQAWGHEYAHGRAVLLEHGSEVYEAEDRSALVDQPAVSRRAWEISWSDPVSSHDRYDDTDPDHVTWALYAATPEDVQAQVSRTGGPLRPVVYLPSIEVAAVAQVRGYVTYDLPHCAGAIYSRLLQRDQAVSLDGVLGDEMATETQRIQRLTGVEIV